LNTLNIVFSSGIFAVITGLVFIIYKKTEKQILAKMPKDICKEQHKSINEVLQELKNNREFKTAMQNQNQMMDKLFDKFDQIEKDISNKFEKIEDKIDNRFEKVDKRIDDLDKGMGILRNDFNGYALRKEKEDGQFKLETSKDVTRLGERIKELQHKHINAGNFLKEI
jgi:Mg2+ and Co2+ transporter CorA